MFLFFTGPRASQLRLVSGSPLRKRRRTSKLWIRGLGLGVYLSDDHSYHLPVFTWTHFRVHLADLWRRVSGSTRSLVCLWPVRVCSCPLCIWTVCDLVFVVCAGAITLIYLFVFLGPRASQLGLVGGSLLRKRWRASELRIRGLGLGFFTWAMLGLTFMWTRVPCPQVRELPNSGWSLYIYINIYIICIYVYMYICMYIHAYIHIHTHIHTYISKMNTLSV